MKERVLVTGSSGFLGSRLRERLGQEEYEIKRLRHPELEGPEEIIGAFNPDIIFHLAAYGNYYFQTGVREIYRANIMKLLYLLEATNEIPYRAFINCGTSSEYGEKDKPMKEDDLLEPDTFYAASKAGGTLLARAWAIQKNKPIITIRPFSITGVGEQDNHLIPTLIRSCLYGEWMRFVPNPVHDFIDIDDVIDGMLLLVEHANRYRGKVFNIGSGRQYTNEEVKQVVEKVTGKKARIEIVEEMRGYDTRMWVADKSDLRVLEKPTLRSLGWKPKKTLEQSIQEMVDYYEQRITKKDSPD